MQTKHPSQPTSVLQQLRNQKVNRLHKLSEKQKIYTPHSLRFYYSILYYNLKKRIKYQILNQNIYKAPDLEYKVLQQVEFGFSKISSRNILI